MVYTPSRAMQAIQREAAFRELARRRLAGFLRYRFHAEKRALLWNWHLDYVCELLEAVTLRQIKRLTINWPPRMLKTEVVCETWPAWMIGKDPGPQSAMVSASYSASLAERASRRCRRIVESPWFQATFGEHEHGTTWTNAEWELADGASRVAAGARGTITGKGGDHLVGDDLLKPQDANSEVVREETNHWLGETFRSRFNDPINGTWVIVAQRLHEQDPCGYLLEQMKDPQADQWYHVCLPNECDRRRVYSYGDFFYERQKGELLHGERFGEKETAAAKRGMAINYEGQYNQRPVKMEGAMLQPRWIHKVDKDVPRLIKELGLRPNLYIDLATKEKETEKDDPDYTVMAVWARDSIGRFWKLDQWRDRAPLNEVVRVLIEWHKRYGIWRSVCEKGGLINTLQPFLTEACRTMRRPAIKIDKIPYGEVAQRAHALRALAAAGMIYMPAAAPWLLDTETEWRQYPKGAHDDIVTVDSYAAMDLQMLRSADPPPPARQVPDGALTGKDVDDALKAAGYAVPKR